MKESPKAKLAICLQVYDGDAQLGRRLTELICRIEPKKRSDIEFIVSARRGTNKFTVEDIRKEAATKFENVHVIQGKRFGAGWAMGCNDLWQETMMRVSSLYDTGKITSTGVLTFESDCIPLRPDWLNVLTEEWLEAENAQLEAVGHFHGDPPTHINGNAIFDARITIHHPELSGSDAQTGWDVHHGQLLMSIGMDTPYIYQLYRIKGITRDKIEELRKQGEIPSIFHGVKGTAGMEAIESMIDDGTFFTRTEPSNGAKVEEIAP